MTTAIPMLISLEVHVPFFHILKNTVCALRKLLSVNKTSWSSHLSAQVDLIYERNFFLFIFFLKTG